MFEYWLYVCVSAATVLILACRELGLKRVVFYLWVVFASIFIGFRYGVGTDYYNYERWFISVDGPLYNYKEPLFNLLVLVVRSFASYNDFLFLCAIITILIVYYALRTILPGYARIATVIMVLGMSAGMMGGFRMTIAMSLLMMAYGSLLRLDKRMFWTYYAVAVMVHYAALIFIVVWVVKSRSTKEVLLCFCVFILLVYSGLFGSFLGSLMYGVGDGMHFGVIVNKASSYVFEKDYSEKLIGLTSLVKKVLLIGYLVYWRKKIIRFWPHYDLFFVVTVAGYGIHIALGYSEYAFVVGRGVGLLLIAEATLLLSPLLLVKGGLERAIIIFFAFLVEGLTMLTSIYSRPYYYEVYRNFLL